MRRLRQIQRLHKANASAFEPPRNQVRLTECLRAADHQRCGFCATPTPAHRRDGAPQLDPCLLAAAQWRWRRLALSLLQLPGGRVAAIE